MPKAYHHVFFTVRDGIADAEVIARCRRYRDVAVSKGYIKVRDHRVATRGRHRSWRLVSLSPSIFLWTQLPTSAINIHHFDPV